MPVEHVIRSKYFTRGSMHFELLREDGNSNRDERTQQRLRQERSQKISSFYPLMSSEMEHELVLIAWEHQIGEF